MEKRNSRKSPHSNLDDVEISVVILTWNCLDVLSKTLENTLEELKGHRTEIIVVDNRSIDGTLSFLSRYERIYNNIFSVRNCTNKGISAGKNQGIKLSRGNFVLLLDGDVMPVKNSIMCLYRHMKEHTDIEALGFYPHKWNNQMNKEGGQKYHENYCHEIIDVKEWHRACMFYGMYRKEVFEKGLKCDESGPFGEEGYGWEDHDFYLTQRSLGIKQYVCHINNPAGRYYHAINSSIRIMGRPKYIQTSPAREAYFKKKWGPNWKTLYTHTKTG